LDPEKAARANLMYRSIQLAHIRGIIGLHHAPTSEQMLESYRGAFDSHMARPGRSLVPGGPDRHVPENVLRIMAAEAAVIQEILAKCYDADKQKMLANLAANPSLLEKMPAIMDYSPPRPTG